MYVDAHNSAQNISDQHFALECPHCQATSSVTAVSIPRYELLLRLKPKYIGIVYRCDACNWPIFLRFEVTSYTKSRVELSRRFTQVEKPIARYEFEHVPEDIERVFSEALVCYSHGCYNAFASMCRRTAKAVFSDLGESGRLKIFDQMNEVRDFGDIDETIFRQIEKVVFDRDSESDPNLPDLDEDTAGILLEIMKDMLHENYVRKGRLQQAMALRRQATETGPDEAAD